MAVTTQVANTKMALHCLEEWVHACGRSHHILCDHTSHNVGLRFDRLCKHLATPHSQKSAVLLSLKRQGVIGGAFRSVLVGPFHGADRKLVGVGNRRSSLDTVRSTQYTHTQGLHQERLLQHQGCPLTFNGGASHQITDNVQKYCKGL